MTGRGAVQLYEDQLSGIAAWHRARHSAEADADRPGQPRELRLDLARRVEVLRREHAAMIGRLSEELRSSARPLCTAPPLRAVLAHRAKWFRDRAAAVLEAAGVRVVARLDNGADTVGVVVAEQPDLALVADSLVMVKGTDVIRAIRRFAPRTIVVAQAGSDAAVGALLEAGARTAFTARVSPEDVAAAVTDKMSSRRSRRGS